MAFFKEARIKEIRELKDEKYVVRYADKLIGLTKISLRLVTDFKRMDLIKSDLLERRAELQRELRFTSGSRAKLLATEIQVIDSRLKKINEEMEEKLVEEYRIVRELEMDEKRVRRIIRGEEHLEERDIRALKGAMIRTM